MIITTTTMAITTRNSKIIMSSLKTVTPPPAVNRNHIQPRQLREITTINSSNRMLKFRLRSNEPSPYGYQQQPLQHQRGGDGNVIYRITQREQYRRDIAAEERRRIYEQNQQ